MRIKEIQLKTHCLDAQKKFYTEVLALPLIFENKYNFAVKVGHSKISFNQVKDEKPVYHFAFNIPENQLTEARAWVKERAELITKNGEDTFKFEDWNADAIYFKDPAGNILELIARHNLRNSTTIPFSEKSLLSISEIGYAVEDVELFADAVQHELRAKVWKKHSKTFIPIGNEDGLVIVVPVGKEWYPTEEKAEAFPVGLDAY